MYARLRAIRPEHIESAVNHLLHNMQLMRYADKPSRMYSGGNKRKLSVAIALMGNPPVVFLDEPTAGMDPKARRFLWTQIGRMVKEGRSVILTSHSMDECEALCNRLGIMVNGEFKAFGSPQHIKSKFGDGYTLVLKVRHSTAPIKAHVAQVFPGSELHEEHRGYLHFKLPSSSISSLPAIFAILEQARTTYELEDYELTQTSLESIFCKFAQAQYDTDEQPRRPRRSHPSLDSETRADVQMESIADLHGHDDDDEDGDVSGIHLFEDAGRRSSFDLPPTFDEPV